MTLKKEYLILAVVIAALGLYLFLRNTDRTTYTLPDLAAVPTDNVTKVVIAKSGQKTELNRKDKGWEVSPGNYPADANMVNRMLDSLAALRLTALVSETRNYSRYELDEEKKIQVTAYRNDTIVRAFDIGKAAETMRHTHIALSEDPNVYHARGNFRHDFDQSVESLRDKTVLAFNADDITAFTIESDDQNIAILKNQTSAPTDTDTSTAETPPAAIWQTNDGKTVEAKDIDQLLASLANLKCRTYLTDQSVTDFTRPAYVIRLEGKGTHTLEVFDPKDDTATEMTARSSLRKDPFTLADFDMDPVKTFLENMGVTEDASTP